MISIKRYLTFFTALLPPAASAQSVEMADALRANGKIYVLVAIILTILIGLLVYLIGLDRKLTRLEKEQPEGPNGR
jgi:uncharacterized membrane protein